MMGKFFDVFSLNSNEFIRIFDVSCTFLYFPLIFSQVLIPQCSSCPSVINPVKVRGGGARVPRGGGAAAPLPHRWLRPW